MNLQATVNDQSTFLAGYLYFDLSERLLSRGELFQVVAPVLQFEISCLGARSLFVGIITKLLSWLIF